MKSFNEWKEINEIAMRADSSPIDWSQYYRVSGKDYRSMPEMESAIKSLVNRFRGDFDSDDALIKALHDTVVFVVRGDEGISRMGSSMSLARLGRRRSGDEDV